MLDNELYKDVKALGETQIWRLNACVALFWKIQQVNKTNHPL